MLGTEGGDATGGDGEEDGEDGTPGVGEDGATDDAAADDSVISLPNITFLLKFPVIALARIAYVRP